MPRPIRYLLAAVAAVLLLSGCANTYLLESQVQSFSQITTLPAQPTYRFERSLSQQADPAQQALEALADHALHTAGLRRDDAAPHFAVQVGARTEQVLSPYADPWYGPGWGGWGMGFGGHHGGIAFGGPWPMDSYWFRREVSVLIRELPSNRLVYETHAFSDGPILDNRVVLPAMFDAAMQGFPNPPPGPRRIDIQLGATH
jgi:outer membrane murein-binding lipoprotein Lpp